MLLFQPDFRRMQFYLNIPFRPPSRSLALPARSSRFSLPSTAEASICIQGDAQQIGHGLDGILLELFQNRPVFGHFLYDLLHILGDIHGHYSFSAISTAAP